MENLTHWTDFKEDARVVSCILCGRRQKIWVSFFGDVSLLDLFGITSYRFLCSTSLT